MVRTNKLHLALMNLNGEISSEIVFGYFEKKTALEILKNMTGEDFGYNVEVWRKWIQENRPGALPEENIEPNYPPYLQHLFKKNDLKYPLEIAYRNYLESDLNVAIAEILVTVLEQNGLETESQCLRIYLSEGSCAKRNIKEWENKLCTISLNLPDNAEVGDLWFDPVELNLAILVPNPEGISHHVKSWVSTHPVYVWQYRAFLSLVKIGEKLDMRATPSDYLNLNRFKSQDSLLYVTGLYQDEAISYSSWMRKSLCGQSNLKAMEKYFSSKELSYIFPNTLKLWDSGEFQEDYRVAVGHKSIDKNASLDYDDIIDENYEDLENLPDRMLYEEWDERSNIGMLTVVPVFIGLGQQNTTSTLHYELLNRSPRPILETIS
jgi:hypothetical protein